MAIYTKFVEEWLPKVPTLLRRMSPQVTIDDGTETSSNIINLLVALTYEVFDARGEALEEMMATGWPLATASAWVLDEHWGPYHDVQRNGGTDSEFRLFIRAKRLLNRSWGAADQALEIFALLLPAAGFIFTPYYPKAWVISITGIPMADAAEAIAFMTKKPSPLGGGFSVCGDNGFALVVDPECFNYSSVYGVIGVDYVVDGFFGSVYGAGGGVQAGYAHVAAV